MGCPARSGIGLFGVEDIGISGVCGCHYRGVVVVIRFEENQRVWSLRGGC